MYLKQIRKKSRLHVLPSKNKLGAGIAQWLKRRTRDWKVQSSRPCRSGGEFSSPGLIFCAAVARKRSRSFCQKCRWQVTAKHACTLHMWVCMKWRGAWLYGVHRTRRDGTSFTWHQLSQRCKYTTSVDIPCQRRKYTTSVDIPCQRRRYTTSVDIPCQRRRYTTSVDIPCQRCKYTTSVDIQKRAIKS